MITNTKFPGKTADWMIEQYVRLRDKKRDLEAAHKEKIARFNEVMRGLEGELLDAMKGAGLTSLKSPHGTAFQAIRSSAKVVDWQAALGYIRDHEAWDLLEQRVSKTGVITVMEETQESVPGVEITSELVVNVRRPNERA